MLYEKNGRKTICFRTLYVEVYHRLCMTFILVMTGFRTLYVEVYP